MSQNEPFNEPPANGSPKSGSPVFGSPSGRRRRNHQASFPVDGELQHFDVGIHVYDLSKGLVAKSSQAIVGRDGMPGMFHSGLVVYGFEYFFEGGVSRAAKGQTRFGDKFKYLYVGNTTMPMGEFERWVRTQSSATFAMCQYRTIEKNCHSFCDVACRHLCGVGAPPLLDANAQELYAAPIGQLLAPIMTRVSGGVQRLIAQEFLVHAEQRKAVHRRMELAREFSESSTRVPSWATYLFANSDGVHTKKLIVDVLIGGHREEEHGFTMTINDRAAIQRVAEIAAMNAPLLRAGAGRFIVHGSTEPLEGPPPEPKIYDDYDVRSVVDTMASTLEGREPHELGPAADVWRLLAAHPQFAGIAVYSKRLNLAMMRLMQSFLRHPPPLQLALARMLCNYAADRCGAAVLISKRRFDDVLSVLGQSLSSPVAAIRVAGASLAANLANATVVMVRTSLPKMVARSGGATDNLSAVKLLKLLLVFVHDDSGTAAANHECRLRLLLAIHRLVAQGPSFSEAAMGVIPFDANGLMEVCKTEESRRLVMEIAFLLEIGDLEQQPATPSPSVSDEGDLDE